MRPSNLLSFAFLPIFAALAQPVITTQPIDHFLSGTGPITLSVAASGTAPLNYQWLFDGTPIVDATNKSYTVASRQDSQGFYAVIISNISGSVTSRVAELKVFSAVQHSLTNIQPQADGSVELTLAGETTPLFGPYYDEYLLESSSNLVDWTPLAMLHLTNAAFDGLKFRDTNAAQFPQRFYRTSASQLPTPDPQPSGPYAVGTFSMLLTNTLRNNAKFMVTFWYPAKSQAGVLPAKYVESQVSSAYLYTVTSSSSQVAGFYSHSLSNAPFATPAMNCPVVLYDPGASGNRRENTDKAEDLSSWGYVVVGLDTADTSFSVFPNGTVVDGQGTGSTVATVTAAIEGRLLDLRFVLDKLESLNANDSRLGGRLDLDKIGVFGWSLGGATAAQLCLRDSRCKAGAGMDGFFFETNVLTQSMAAPWLFLKSGSGPDQDPGLNLPDGRTDDRLEVYAAQTTNAYWVTVGSTVHGNFADPGLIADSASIANVWGTPVSGELLRGARVSQIIRAYLLSFFNKHLRGQDNHLLDGPSPAFPEVLQVLSSPGVSGPPAYPSAALIQGSDGNFYGTTGYGGASGFGTVFRMTPDGTVTTLVSFNGANGFHPGAKLVEGAGGSFYGTTAFGGTSGNNGTVFQVTSAGTLTTLVTFDGTNGSHPAAALVLGTNGDFYGTTLRGGAKNLGTVFRMNLEGALTTLVSFNGANGSTPFAALVQGTDNNLYGTCSSGGAGGQYGVVYKLTQAGGLTTLKAFGGSNGENPAGGLIQVSDGSFYGTTEFGGDLGTDAGYGFGTVFKVTSDGTLTRLAVFNSANGSFCISALVQGSDGNFYGTTAGGGSGGGGTVFRMTTSGVLTTLVTFNGANGSTPVAPLIQGSDGNFYGTTEFGGAGGLGTVFKVTPAGELTTLVAFGSQ